MASSTDLRQAFGQFGTGVAIIALQNSDNQPVGLTVNSFASVSLSHRFCLGAWPMTRSF